MGGTTISLTNKLIKIEYYLELDRVENSSDLGFITSLIFQVQVFQVWENWPKSLWIFGFGFTKINLSGFQVQAKPEYPVFGFKQTEIKQSSTNH